jgi:hypothetical protein
MYHPLLAYSAHQPMDLASMHSSVESLEDRAEEYIFNRLLPADRSNYESHLLICEQCRQAVEKSEAFIKLFRKAADEGSVQ